MNTTNRLQFRHHDRVFDTREAAIEYIQSQIRFTEEGLAKNDPSYGYSLFAEPTILRYVNEEDETNPHIILVIGSVTNDGTQYSDNRFCVIDIDKTEAEIADLEEELAKAIQSLTIVAQNSNTLNLYAQKTDEGTFVSGDVRVAESHIFDNVRKPNNIMATDTGLFMYVKLEYDPDGEKFTFTVNNGDGTLDTTTVDLFDNYLVSGVYDQTDESLHLQMRNGEEVVIDCENLIAEWGVEGGASRTPVMLFKEEVDYDHTDEHHHVEPWQDVLRADIRLKDESYDKDTKKYTKDPTSTNILDRTSDGRYLYVDGKASNIIYYKNGQKSNVKEALDALNNVKLSTDGDNILVEKTDGFFASSKLEYISSDNKLIFKTSGQNGEKRTEITLNSVELFEHIYYDPSKESLIITYKDNKGETQFVEIPIGELIKDWEWEVQNEGHNVKLVKTRVKSGNDKLSADVKLFEGHNNILVDTNHSLYVRGEADNIKYGEDSNVKEALDEQHAKDIYLEEKIDAETARATAKEEEIDENIARIDTTIGNGFSTDTHETVTYKFNELQDQVNSEAEKLQNEIDRSTAKDEEHDTNIEDLTNKVGTGFTTDPHDNVTYKFEQLSDKVDSEAEKLQNEIDRSETKDTEHDGRLDAIDAEIGEGFEPRNTVRDEIDNLQSEVDAVSADTSMRLTDVINEDESIDVETRNDENGKPTVKVVKVNLSSEVEDNKPNIIKLNADGLYAGVDLSYEEAANKLVFKTTNGTKEIQLESMSSIISIEYNPTKEAIVITYMTNGHEIKTVEIPVGDLINEWRVEDGHPHAVQLEKIRIASGTSEQDVLKASVIITDAHEDNMLVMDNGALYVSNRDIVANAAAIDALEGRMNTAEADIDALEDGLREEASARTLADEALGARIDQEIEDRTADVNAEQNRAEDAELALSNKIDADVLAEQNRAVSAETALDTKINQEIVNREAAVLAEENRAKAVETDLYTKIDTDVLTEKNRAEAAELALSNKIDADVLAEKNRAEGAETALQEEIENEVVNRENAVLAEKNRATSAETALQEALNREIVNREADVDAEESRAIAAETALTNKINTDIEAERTRAISAETALSNKIDADVLAEKTRAEGAEAALQGAIDGEVTRATNEESRIEHLLDDEVARSIAKDTEHDTKIQQNADSILAETVRAKEVENVISGNVISEETRAKAEEEAIKTNLGNEIAARISGDTMLSHLIDDEEENRISGDTLLQNNIDAEEARAREIETRLETWLNQEIDRATNAEGLLNTAITNETLRAQAADNELYRNIADVSASSIAADAQLSNAIAQETSRAQIAENSLREALATETNNRTNAETNLNNAITAETQARQDADDALQAAIDAATHTYSATTTARLVKSADNVVTADVIIPTDNNIIINDEGVKAFVRLDYDAATNKLILEKTSPSGRTHDVVTLNAGSIINSITYDTATKELVIRYQSTSDPEHTEKETRVSVADLFNPMIVNNPSSGSAVELHISQGTGALGEDELSGKVLLTNLDDNAVKIINNGLYVSNSAMTEALDIAKCAKNELGVLEQVVIGSKIDEECGSGYTYHANNLARYINSAESFNNADVILDQNLGRVENKVDDFIDDVDCVDNKANKLFELLYGATAPVMPNCGSGVTYQPYVGACVISAATSFMEADQMLNDQLCELLTMWVSGLTCTNESQWVEDGANRKIQIYTRLSRGKYSEMTDEDIFIEKLESPLEYIDPTNSEFTDTNVLRIACINEGPSGTTPSVESMQNGIYLSNEWDCGLYYGPSDTEAKAKAEAAGYRTAGYSTDETSSASGYDYMNNMRLNPPQP